MEMESRMLRVAIMGGNRDLLETLLERGADPNHREVDDATPLIMAAAQEQVDMVRRLLAAGAEPWLRNNKGLNALDYASMDGEDRGRRLAIIRAIAAHPTCDIDAEGPLGPRPSGGGTALFKATIQGEVESVRLLLSLGARPDIRCAGTLPREIAVEKGYREIVRLFDNPPELAPRVRDRRPGHNFLRLGKEDISSEDELMAETLQAMKTPLADRTQRQVDVLMTMATTAAVHNKLDWLKFLLDVNGGTSYRAVDLDSADLAEGFTVLHDAANPVVDNEEAVRLLLSRGADPTLRSKRGHTPLDVAEGRCQDLCAGTNKANARLLRRHMKEGAVRRAERGLREGTAVIVRGLKKRADLNGLRGVVLSGPGKNGRWEVRLDGKGRGKTTIAAKPANLELVPEEKARRDAMSMVDNMAEKLQSTMLESLIRSHRTGDHDVDVPMEEAARVAVGTFNRALREGDLETVSTMLSDDTQAKVDTLMRIQGTCLECKRVGATKECSLCHRATYCSKACQVQHWPVHKLKCKGRKGKKDKIKA